MNTANSTSTESVNAGTEKIVVPELITVILRPGRHGGFKGFVSEPNHRLNNTLVLFPSDGKNMDLLPYQVVFVATTEIIQKPTDKGFYLSAIPVGERSFSSPAEGRKAAEGIIRQNIEKVILNRSSRQQSKKTFDRFRQQSGEIGFVVTGGHKNRFDAAVSAANIETIQEFASIIGQIANPTPPTGCKIGNRMNLGRHDCIMMVAGEELVASGAAYLSTLGWVIISAYRSPDRSQWAILMTSSPLEAWDYEAPVAKAPPPPRQAKPYNHVAPVARPKPTVVVNSLEALGNEALAVSETESLAIVPASPPPLPSVAQKEEGVDEVIGGSEEESGEVITPQDFDEAIKITHYADKDDKVLVAMTIREMVRLNLREFHPATARDIHAMCADIGEATPQDIKDINDSFLPMMLKQTSGTIAAVVMDLEESIVLKA